MSSQKTITNTDILLSEIITNILPATSKMDILVGFFYFSGFKGIYKELIDKKVRILVGMDAEISIVNSAVKVNEVGFRTATKTDTIKQLKDIFNKIETLDNLEGLEAVQIYIDKIIDGTLEIRRKIVCGTRVEKPSFYYTENEFYGSRALNFIKTERINLKYLTVLLNSNLNYFWLKNKGKMLGKLLQIDKSHLLLFPIKKISEEKQKPFIEKVDQILEITKLSSYDPKNSPKEQLDLEKRIDEMVYELYGLSKEEIKVVEDSLEK